MSAVDMNPVYNYYSSVYLPQSGNKYDNHKKSELRNVYSKMTELNQRSPIFKISLSDQTQEYVLGVKSSATHLKNISAFLSDDESNALGKLTARSSNPSAIEASLLSEEYDKLPEQFTIDVDRLAAKQVNEGSFLFEGGLATDEGDHTFTINSNQKNYSFNININNTDTNLSVQNKLASFINQADIGLTATVRHKGSSHSLAIESEETGIDNNYDLKFSFQDSGQAHDLVTSLNLNNVVQKPENASFNINDNQRISASNNIAINKLIELNIHQTTEGPETITFVPDASEIKNNLSQFVDSFNSILSLANDHSTSQRGARILQHDILNVARKHAEELKKNGIELSEEGSLFIDDETMDNEVKNEDATKLYDNIASFKEDLERKADKISLNPMNFVDKVVVSYPNPEKNFPNPYMPSIYSGMLYNYYT